MAKVTYSLSGRPNKATNQAEIKIRFSHGSQFTQRAKSGYWIEPDYWATEGNSAMYDAGSVKIPRQKSVESDSDKKLRRRLDSLKTNLTKLETYINDAFINVGVDAVKSDSKWLQTQIDRFHNKTTDEISFFDKFDEYIEKNDVTYHRKQLYKVVKRLLMRYELFTNSKITFENLCSDTLFSFEEFAANEYTFCDSDSYRAILAQVEESRTPKPRGKNTIVDIMKILRAFIKWSEQCKGKDPFDGYQIGECIYNETPYYLTVEERNRLYEYDFSYNKQLETQRDIFVFQCLIGARVSDLWNFTKSNVIDDDAVEYIAQKTLGKNAVVTRVPLTETAKNILDKYKDYHGKTLFPFTSQQRYNIDIKKILQAVGIDRIVTTLNPTNRKYEQHPIYEVASSHIARRTFIGNIYKVVQDPNLISSMSGHKEGSKAFARYRAIDDDIKKSVLSKIE
ncbi:MAG: integrase catalytic domain-containing protein [Salinivirgaceae bacterium]|nr:integrase catalytic domain-containing protein [Salinivirgaceae bacterium]